MAENYELTSPVYDLMLKDYQRNAELYDGGRSVEGQAERYLTQHPYEKDNQFEIRKKRAAYRNFAAPTVDLFASSVTDDVNRESLKGVAGFDDMQNNSDRQNNSPDVFFKNVVSRAAAQGAHFVLVDMPRALGEARTQAEAREQGLVPYFVRIPAESLINWAYDEEGSLEWVVVKDVRTETLEPFTKPVLVKTITLWRKNSWERFESRDGAKYAPVDGGPLSIGMVPIVPFLYEPDELDPGMTGRSVIDDVASLIVRVFNQDSELDKMLFDAALPILVAYGLTQEEEEVIAKATNYLWRFSSSEAKLEYVEPSGAAFSAKRQQIVDDVESIREISLRQTKPKGAGTETAEAKRLDTIQLSSQLADFARRAAAAERRCWEIAGKFVGIEQAISSAIDIKYNETFDPEALREKLTQAFMELLDGGNISRETVWKQLGMTEDEITQEKALMEQERQGSEGASGSLGNEITNILREGNA